jgi:DNA polymerase elongation subunit (family B)
MDNKERIVKFLEGRDPKKYIVNIEVPYGKGEASLIINDPVRGKRVDTDKFESFVWFKEEITKLMYEGNKTKILKGTKKYGITITKLKTTTNGSERHDRLETGYKYMAKCDGAFSRLLSFFREGDVDVYGEAHKKFFMALSPVEQYMIQSGKRLFKGMDDYNDLHRMQFDLETTGLHPKGPGLNRAEILELNRKINDPENNEDLTKFYEFSSNNTPLRHKDSRIFQIGYKDNRGNEEILEVIGETKAELDNYEKYVILKFFSVVDELSPDIIAGFNSEDFDWPFFVTRCEILGLDIELVAKTLDKSGFNRFKRVEKQLKLGQESQNYKQTTMWGYNIIDVSHAVRRAKAIDSNIKKWGLKYITKHSGLNKPNRVYVEGDKIFKTWADKTNDYAFNESDGIFYVITEDNPIKDGYTIVTGAYIVRRYLLDDLWETEEVDNRYNQASFLLSKIIPTQYSRSTTMGTAGIWKLIMMAYSYENRLAIPNLMPQRTFTGGLSRLLEVGFAKRVGKLDYAALYPNIEITWDTFPDVDISGVMKDMLLFIASTRDEYKELKNVNSALAREMQANIDNGVGLSEDDLKFLKAEKARYSALANMYDKKQLPIKILGNSFFGSLGAPHIFPWGDVNCAEETTCRGRQYLRLMVYFFMKRDLRPLVGDTDGFNFAIPDSIDNYRYTPKGTHRFTEDNKDIETVGLNAVVDEFNEKYMIGRMGLDIDDVCESTINFSRKNYGNLINGKTKLVGNTIKSSKMPIYIEEFLGEGVKHLLNGDGYEFIELYNRTVDNIYNYQIPLVKIASKANIKQTIAQYNADMLKTNKNGSFKAKKAHMELIIMGNEQISLGETVYYVNTGTVKSHGDCKVITDKLTGKKSVILQSKLILAEQIEKNPNLTTDEYNVPKYLAAFNNRIHPLLVCFSPEIRDSILTNMVKNKKTNQMELTTINRFTKKQCELSSGIPFKDGDQDTIEELMTLEDKEIDFWIRVDKVPNNLDDLDMDWEVIKAEYAERKRLERIEGIRFERTKAIECTKLLEIDEILTMKATGEIGPSLQFLGKLDVHADANGKMMIYLISTKWGADLLTFDKLFKYQQWATDRSTYYQLTKDKSKHTYKDWLLDVWRNAIKNEDFIKADKIRDELSSYGYIIDMETDVDSKQLKLFTE